MGLARFAWACVRAEKKIHLLSCRSGDLSHISFYACFFFWFSEIVEEEEGGGAGGRVLRKRRIEKQSTGRVGGGGGGLGSSGTQHVIVIFIISMKIFVRSDGGGRTERDRVPRHLSSKKGKSD